jgi:superfamily II RNA helicase
MTTIESTAETTIAEYEASLPYALSEFQRRAIEGLLRGHHVLVTAHTGSGKTLPALFAIQHFTLSTKLLRWNYFHWRLSVWSQEYRIKVR